MSVFGIAMVKNEADIIEQTIRHMLDQVDAVIVADNGSTDDTYEILEALPITLIEDTEVGYYQSRKMSALAFRAADEGADWIVPFDADEIWLSPAGRIADVLGDLPDAVSIATAALYDHVATAIDEDTGNPFADMPWRRIDPTPLPKVACRPCLPVTIEQGNHGAHYGIDVAHGQLIVRHFPLRSVEQMIRKARNGGAAYEATDLPPETGAHWRGWNQLSDEQLGEVFHEHYWSDDPEADPSLVRDPCP